MGWKVVMHRIVRCVPHNGAVVCGRGGHEDFHGPQLEGNVEHLQQTL